MKLLLENWRKYLTEEDVSCENNLVVFMAGGPGSGKGTVLRNLGLNLPVINPDDEFERELQAQGISMNMQGMSDERFVDVDPQDAEQRNATRSSQGGRSLPTKIISKVHDKVQANRQPYADLFGDNFIYVDNKGSEEELKGTMKSSLSKLF